MALPVPDPEEVYEELHMRSTAFTEKIRAILGLTSDQYLVVGFNEVGVLHLIHSFFGFDDSSDRLGTFDDFFEICNASKILLKLVPLSPLDQASIEEHLEKSTFKKAPVSNVLRHQDFSINDLSELLLEYTDGVPCLTVGAVSVLLKYVAATPNVSFTKESIESILRLSDKRKVAMKKLILSYLYCVQFGSRDFLTDSGQDGAYVFDLLADFGLYRREYSKPGKREMCQVSIPKLLASFLETQVGTDTLSAVLFRAQPVHFFYESSCRVLEGFVATKFYLSLALRHYENSLLSTLSQLSPVWSRMNLEFPTDSAAFHVMPSIHFQEASEEQEGPSGKRTTFGPNEWERIVAEELPYNKIYIPMHATSNGPDILFKLQERHWSSRGIGWDDISDEIEKFMIPVFEQVLSKNPNIHCMLIISSTKLVYNVAVELNGSSRCYTCGNKLPQGIDIPERCELVILCEEDVENFIGKSILSGLREAFTLTDNPSLKFYDMIEKIRRRCYAIERIEKDLLTSIE
ncbi:hypothetical protein GAYE_SCF47G5883 [Galdieria yellowstonensis]|uniref:Archaeal ATPase n=1 Tax=Galdieria yellowstonensis TaxID=3028027 RepID=A0AAV9IKW9_9RHOD|nr:hypothetical protein GAYE_SCF47G5883 [Galdieria yellowstonensis]